MMTGRLERGRIDSVVLEEHSYPFVVGIWCLYYKCEVWTIEGIRLLDDTHVSSQRDYKLQVWYCLLWSVCVTDVNVNEGSSRKWIPCPSVWISSVYSSLLKFTKHLPPSDPEIWIRTINSRVFFCFFSYLVQESQSERTMNVRTLRLHWRLPVTETSLVLEAVSFPAALPSPRDHQGGRSRRRCCPSAPPKENKGNNNHSTKLWGKLLSLCPYKQVVTYQSVVTSDTETQRYLSQRTS